MVPVKIPWKQRDQTKGQNVVEDPNTIIAVARPSGADSNTGLRPKRSER